jgi:hypothetical protein
VYDLTGVEVWQIGLWMSESQLVDMWKWLKRRRILNGVKLHEL